jgi:hypothetical protein
MDIGLEHCQANMAIQVISNSLRSKVHGTDQAAG